MENQKTEQLLIPKRQRKQLPSSSNSTLTGLSRQDYFREVLVQLQTASDFFYLQARSIFINETDTFKNYKLEVDKTIDIVSRKLVVDKVALQLLPPLSSVFSQWKPVVTYEDGNCFPRTLSFLVYGIENNHREIRVRIIYEGAPHKFRLFLETY